MLSRSEWLYFLFSFSCTQTEEENIDDVQSNQSRRRITEDLDCHRLLLVQHCYSWGFNRQQRLNVEQIQINLSLIIDEIFLGPMASRFFRFYVHQWIIVDWTIFREKKTVIYLKKVRRRQETWTLSCRRGFSIEDISTCVTKLHGRNKVMSIFFFSIDIGQKETSSKGCHRPMSVHVCRIMIRISARFIDFDIHSNDRINSRTNWSPMLVR